MGEKSSSGSAWTGRKKFVFYISVLCSVDIEILDTDNRQRLFCCVDSRQDQLIKERFPHGGDCYPLCEETKRYSER